MNGKLVQRQREHRSCLCQLQGLDTPFRQLLTSFVNVLTDKRDSTLRFNELDSIPNHPFLINIHSPICHVSATSSEEQTCNESKEHFPQPSFVNANTELRTNLKQLNNLYQQTE